MKLPSLLAAALLTLPAAAQTPAATPDSPPPYRAAVGVLGSYRTVGLLGEVRARGPWALKLAAVRQSDGTIPGEYSTAGLGLLTYYLPTHLKAVEPMIGVGGLYSRYHWQQHGGRGHVRDLNVGGGFGANVRFHRHLRTGLQLFVANGFRAEYDEGGATMRKTGRRLLVLPALTLEVLL
ncbi:hypothetical protein [Hymenobacter jeollabukensis]|uniref:Outer membrane protein beta-barrel domain-containing protein n=1 Tax=Hymenobacter jeollabukensis TaxID=2025313 RepID=A0A5R8WY57_9BACT|nr:hypothetical protein [Hymenobacter jeollabukensis]TLM97075.1 hypothetical protein FDY95_03530 [Hymenobacter jeollabukensis]